MGVLQQLSLLIWKDVKLRIRAPVLTLLSIAWPIAVFTAVAIIRNDFPPEQHTNCYYNAKAMPSSGAVNFMQSYLCDLETACIPGNSSTVESNAVPSYAGASVSQVFDTLEPILSNENVTDSLNDISGSIETLMGLANALEAGINVTDIDYRVGDLFKNESHVAWFLENVIELDPDVVDAFLNSSININQLLELTGYVDFYRITCNETELMKYLSFPYGSDPRQISKELCRINVTSIPAIIGEFQEQLNIEYLLLQVCKLLVFRSNHRE
ncbi:retinal-specific phospholipid-transporting ATPase ABCA4-like [Anneissia japonica]|uniref:retinal-specific phospholipid-transporting ATPase ABCA4-like n=1 Tax=Anneissia japonica TaxID=1529436 RepID=UPI001425743E|nr:retinal-specific phospholipid-transporting ATPase ABCA4-like [Anneissia japonica]